MSEVPRTEPAAESALNKYLWNECSAIKETQRAWRDPTMRAPKLVGGTRESFPKEALSHGSDCGGCDRQRKQPGGVHVRSLEEASLRNWALRRGRKQAGAQWCDHIQGWF